MSTTSKTIHSTTPEVVSWLNRSAIYSVMSLAKNPARATGKRVIARLWLDTDELELQFISGTWTDVVLYDSKIIPHGTIADAQAYAGRLLSGTEA